MNRKTIFRVLGLTLVGLILAGPSQAMILFNQDLNTGLSGTYSNTGGQVRADNFMLDADAQITDVHWYGFYEVPLNPLDTSVDFRLRFYADASGLPGTLLYDQLVAAAVANSTMAVTGGSFVDSMIYEFTADPIDPLSVNAGETLWISLAEEDAATPREGGTQWLWNYSSVASMASASINDNGMDDWSPDGGNLAFYLTGESDGGTAIPEPATMLLFGSGLVGAVIRKRRR